ncbi:MAG: methyltransferase domain-containing protein [Gammaproteobacteria bacterium]
MSEQCRFCDAPLDDVFVDLGMSPIANDYVPKDNSNSMEPFYPLCVFVCSECLLVQLPAVQSAGDIFRDDYAYFSSFSDSWVDHARRYVESMIDRFGFGSQHSVVELASNDGYLLQFFDQQGVPVLGVEPCANVAEAAKEKGIPSIVEFFGTELAGRMATEKGSADLIIGNNVLAHVPDLNDFVGGMKMLLSSTGIITMEFPHLLRLMEHNQFDTIYHEHFSYFSFLAVRRIFAHHGLTIFDVDELPTHGGSLRIYARHTEDDSQSVSDSVEHLSELETSKGFDRLDVYRGFEARVHRTKRELLKFLIEAREQGKRVAAYGAPAKGNTLLNYCGVRTDLVEYTVDRAPSKQETLLPGVRIPVFSPDKILEDRPDYVLILPWNISDEIVGKMSAIREWGGRFVVPIPEVKVLD